MKSEDEKVEAVKQSVLRPGIQVRLLDETDIIELRAASPTNYTKRIDVSDSRVPLPVETDPTDDLVTPDNFELYLPPHSEDLPPTINNMELSLPDGLLTASGFLTPAAQDLYDEPGPERQACYDPTQGR